MSESPNNAVTPFLFLESAIASVAKSAIILNIRHLLNIAGMLRNERKNTNPHIKAAIAISRPSLSSGCLITCSRSGSPSRVRMIKPMNPAARSNKMLLVATPTGVLDRTMRHMRMASPPMNEIMVWLKNAPIITTSTAPITSHVAPRSISSSRSRNAAITI